MGVVRLPLPLSPVLSPSLPPSLPPTDAQRTRTVCHCSLYPDMRTNRARKRPARARVCRVWDDLYYYSGFEYAKKKWAEGGAGRAVAIAILCLDFLVLLCLLAWFVRCVRKGCCFWLCMKASEQEQTSLTSGGGCGDSSSSSGTRTGASEAEGDKEMEMGSLPDRIAVEDEPDDPAMRA